MSEHQERAVQILENVGRRATQEELDWLIPFCIEYDRLAAENIQTRYAALVEKKKGKKEVKRAIQLVGTDVTLELSKFATPKTDKEFIHLDRLPDGSWRLLYNVKDAPDLQQVEAFQIIRED